jgi:hypothetical protein
MKAQSATIAPSEAGYTTATDSLRQIFSTLQLRGLRVGSIYEGLGISALYGEQVFRCSAEAAVSLPQSNQRRQPADIYKPEVSQALRSNPDIAGESSQNLAISI